MWVDRNGDARALSGVPARNQEEPRLSPDREKIAVQVRGDSLNGADIWVYDTVHGSQTRLTFKGRNGFPIWSPDGKSLVYYSRNASGHANLYMMNASDASSPARQLTTSDCDQRPSSWTAAGNLIAFLEDHPGGTNQIWVLPMDGDQKPRLFLESRESRFELRHPEFSPDGKWMAYSSNESGTWAVYVRAYPGPAPGEPYQVSPGGGKSPIWVAGGREILY